MAKYERLSPEDSVAYGICYTTVGLWIGFVYGVGLPVTLPMTIGGVIYYKTYKNSIKKHD